nr:hypothetical protein [Tanacetum cinerariifolium]
DFNKNTFVPASMDYDHEIIPKSKDWVERHNPVSKLLNFNTRRIFVPESLAIKESLRLIGVPNDPESSKESEPEPQKPLPYLNILQGHIIKSTEPVTTSVPTEVEINEQDFKINELTKLVQMLMDEKVNSSQKS